MYNYDRWCALKILFKDRPFLCIYVALNRIFNSLFDSHTHFALK